MDETDITVKEKWTPLYHAVDKEGNPIDFSLSPTRNTAAAKRLLGKAWRMPKTITPDQVPAYATAPGGSGHRQVKCLNNREEADHGKRKRLRNPVGGFQSMKTASATIKGFELMRLV